MPKPLKTNVVCVVARPILGYGSSSNDINGLELELHSNDDLPIQEELLETMKKQFV
jgi:hypothetical protein